METPHPRDPRCRPATRNPRPAMMRMEQGVPFAQFPATRNTRPATIRMDTGLNVFLEIEPMKSKTTTEMRTFFAHFLPMIGSIRVFYCDNGWIGFLEQHFPGAMAIAKEFELYDAKLASIPTYMNWLSAPQDIDVHGPRFLKLYADSKTIFAIVDDVRKNFLAANVSATYVISLHFNPKEQQQHLRADEFKIENAATKEQLTARNASFKSPKHGKDVHYVEIVRNSIDDKAKIREWIKKRVSFDEMFNYDVDHNKVILIDQPNLTIGRITKEVECKPANLRDNDNADGPSTSAKRKRNLT